MQRFRTPVSWSLALAALTMGCADRGANGEDPADPAEAPAATDALDIQTAKAVPIDEAPLGEASGRIVYAPQARVAVTAPFAGVAVRVFVIEGQPVRAGQPLAQLRAPESVRIRSDLASAQARLAVARARAERLNQLAKEGIIARARAQQAEAELAQAQAELAAQRRLAALGQTGPDGSMALRAPIAGKVAHVAIATGGPVDPMDAPFVIESSGAYQLELQLAEALARKVRTGMTVRFAAVGGGGDAEGAEGRGRILTIAPSIDPATQSRLARAAIDREAESGAQSAPVVAGQLVRATILGDKTSDKALVAIPASAVTRMGERDVAFVKTKEGFEPRALTVVSLAAGKASISKGLRAGEVVATSAIPELKAMAAE